MTLSVPYICFYQNVNAPTPASSVRTLFQKMRPETSTSPAGRERIRAGNRDAADRLYKILVISETDPPPPVVQER
jgi:hypothetical protein